MNKFTNYSISPSLVMGCIFSWFRLQAGIDQRQLAESLGITQASWSRIENGHAIVNFEQILASCKALNVDLVYMTKLYIYVTEHLELKSIIVSPNPNFESKDELKRIVKETISQHMLSVSSKSI